MKFRKAFDAMINSSKIAVKLLFDSETLKSNYEEANLNHEKNFRDVCLSFLKASDVDLSVYDHKAVLGDLIKMPQRLRDPEYAAMCKEIGEKQEVALDEAYEAAKNLDERLHAQRPLVDRTFTDSEKNNLQNVIAVLPENPFEDEYYSNCSYDEAHEHVNEMVECLGLNCVQCATSELPICILIGVTKPLYIADFVGAWNGFIIPNTTSYYCDPLSMLDCEDDEEEE